MAKHVSKLPELKQKIKESNVNGLFLFYGNEIYLKNSYIQKISSLIDDGGFDDFNKLSLDGAKTSFEDFDDAIDSYPMMCDKKLIIIKNSRIFSKATEEQKQYWTKRLDDIPDYVTIIFDENEVDKRSALYKKAAKNGMEVEFEYLKDDDLVTWVLRETMKEKKKMTKDTAQYFVSICDEGMTNIKNELDKLFNYCDADIGRSDVDRIVSKAVGIRVFELTDCIMEKNPDKALTILSELKTIKEPAFKLLYLLSSTFDKMLKCSLLISQGENFNDIAAQIGVAPFIAKKYAQNAKGFGEKYLIRRVCAVADIDLSIKNGDIEDWDALTKYVLDACAEMN